MERRWPCGRYIISHMLRIQIRHILHNLSAIFQSMPSVQLPHTAVNGYYGWSKAFGNEILCMLTDSCLLTSYICQYSLI